jgi:hypothetical protein
MAYKQYSVYAYTGDVEAAKNRIANNAANLTASEEISYPLKFDLFSNKENASVGGYAVTEEHALADLDGNKLFLDHRLLVDATGGHGGVAVSDGILDMSTVDIVNGSIEFSSLPSASPFSVSYSARSDKIQDSHLNSLQNVVMRMQHVMGLRAAIQGIGTGLVTLPIVTTYNPATQAALDGIQTNVLPNIVLLGNLEGDLKIGSTENSDLDSFGGDGFRITIGNAGTVGSVDEIRMSSDDLRVNDSRAGTLQYSCDVQDKVFFSGATEFASQVTIGHPYAGTGNYALYVPPHMTGYYQSAMLRVNGPMYYGDGISGVGNVTFFVVSGEVVDVVGAFEATTIHVERTLDVDGAATFNAKVDANSPGYFTTNQDIQLRDDPTGTPTKIDGLDPSYANVAIESASEVKGTISSYHFTRTFTDDSVPFVSGEKQHPVHLFPMYPMVGGWMFTGLVKYATANFHSHKTVLLLDSAIRDVSEFGNNYGSYCPGLFDPGDTYVEINDGGSAKVSYPVYYHEISTGGAGVIVTGLNLYVNSDDNVLETPSVVGQSYRIFQPSNAPLEHMTSDFSDPTAPTATFGDAAGGYYSSSQGSKVDVKTRPANLGPSVAVNVKPVYKRLTSNSTVQTSVLQALQRSIDYEQIVNGGGWGVGSHPGGKEIGVAYLFVSTHSEHMTQHGQVKFKASPNPFGIATSNIWGSAGLNMNPGQWAAVGEIIASTTDGTNWTHISTVSYRPNAFYDSCWVPLVNFRDSHAALTVPPNLGRCLPFYGSEDGSGVDLEYGPGEGDHNFWVEHNIGPVQSLDEISVRVFIGKYSSNGYGTPGVGNWTSFHRLSAGSSRLISQYSHGYHDDSDWHPGIDHDSAGAGFFKEVTRYVDVRYFDTRFCRISFENDTPFDQPGSAGNADYIRVIIKRTR